MLSQDTLLSTIICADQDPARTNPSVDKDVGSITNEPRRYRAKPKGAAWSEGWKRGDTFCGHNADQTHNYGACP